MVHNGATGTWTVRSVGKTASVHAKIASDGSVKETLDGWKISDGTPLAGAMTGQVAGNPIDVEGRWANGAHTHCYWKR